MEDTHYKIMKTLQEYFKVNQRWELKQSHNAGIEARRLLSELRDLAVIRREEIQTIRAAKPKIKSPKYKESLLKAQENKDNT